MSQLSFFPDPIAEGLRAKGIGLDTIEEHHDSFIRVARFAAIRISAERGHVHIDDVRTWLDEQGLIAPHKNCFGAIFRATREGRWVKVGERASRIASTHAHVSPLWRFVSAEEEGGRP